MFAVRRMSPEREDACRLALRSTSSPPCGQLSPSPSSSWPSSPTSVAYLVGLVGALILLAATVLAPWMPVFAADFANRAGGPRPSGGARRRSRRAPPGRPEARARPARRVPAQALRRPLTAQPQYGQMASGQNASGPAGAASAGARPGQHSGQPAAGQPGFGCERRPPGCRAHAPAATIFTPGRRRSPSQQARRCRAAPAAATDDARCTAEVPVAADTADSQAVKTAGVSAGDANFTAEAAEAAPETRGDPGGPRRCNRP